MAESSLQLINEKAIMGPEWDCTMPSSYMLNLLARCFAGLLTVGVVISLTFLPALGTRFLLLSCLVQPWYECFFLFLLYLVLLMILWCFSFSEGKQRLVDLEGGRLGLEWREKKLWLRWERRVYFQSIVTSLKEPYSSLLWVGRLWSSQGRLKGRQHQYVFPFEMSDATNTL